MRNYRQEALQNIQTIGRRNESEFDKKMEPLYRDEEFKRLNREYKTCVIENARMIAYEMTPAIEKELEAKFKLEGYLIQHGVGEGPKRNCDKCKDSGMIGFELCDCVKKEMSRLMLEDSGFRRLENFDDSIENIREEPGDLLMCYEKMRKYCHLKTPSFNLVVLSGGTGVGKTHLTKCMANEFLLEGKVVNFVTSQKLSQDIKDIAKNLKEDTWRNYLSVNVLFIDDLGAESVYRDATLPLLQSLITERLQRQLQTIITTNLTPGEIEERYGARIFSRLYDVRNSICIEIQGKDMRLCRSLKAN